MTEASYIIGTLRSMDYLHSDAESGSSHFLASHCWHARSVIQPEGT